VATTPWSEAIIEVHIPVTCMSPTMIRRTPPLTHYSVTRYVAHVLGFRPLKQGAGAPDLAAAFGLR
jgi:hypothetical protein